MTLDEFFYGADTSDKNKEKFIQDTNVLNWDENDTLGIKNINYTVGDEK